MAVLTAWKASMSATALMRAWTTDRVAGPAVEAAFSSLTVPELSTGPFVSSSLVTSKASSICFLARSQRMNAASRPFRGRHVDIGNRSLGGMANVAISGVVDLRAI